MKKTALILILSFSFLLMGVRTVSAVAYLTVSPTSGNYNVGDTFTVTLGVNSGGEAIGGVDGLGTYDSSKLELSSISQASGMVFSDVEGGGACTIDKTASAGKFSFSCYVNSATGEKAVNGGLITVVFKVTKTGTATLNYTCSGTSTTDSNISKISSALDLITCSSNQSGSYTIGSGSSSTVESTATPTSTSTTTSELPKTGNTGVTIGLIALGLVSLISAAFLKFL